MYKLSKNEAKFIQSLCHKKHRQAEGLFIAEGVKLVEEILKSNFQIKKVYATEKWADGKAGLKDLLSIVSEDDLARISTLQTPNHVLAIVEQPTTKPLIQFKNNITLLLDGIQDPGNFGTIIRIADWFGIHQIICSHDTVELYNPKVIQSTMGSFIRVDVLYENLVDLLKTAQVPIYGALLLGEGIYNIGKPKEGVLVIGSEGKGIGEELLPMVTHPITIPRIGGAESLNAAVATGILLSHLVG
jgi:TrmH family RNA methyltransferase